MACPFPDCQSPDVKVQVRYGAREIECPSCGKFKMAEALFETGKQAFEEQQDELENLHEFIHARNQEGKVPMLTDENWQMLAAEQGKAGSRGA